MRAQLPKNFEPYSGLVRVTFFLDADFITLNVEPVERDGMMRLTGDIDNYLKAIFDAGNGVLWNDDKQVVHVDGVKW